MGEEATLVERARANDVAALGAIYDRYASQIYAYLYRYLGDRETAEDLTSEVFVRMLDALRRERFASTSLPAWLYRIAHNLAVDHCRRRRLDTVPLLDLPAASGCPGATLERKQAEERLRVALRRLTPDQQQVILLRFGQGLRAGEVAQMLEKPERAVRSLQHRALAALRRLME